MFDQSLKDEYFAKVVFLFLPLPTL